MKIRARRTAAVVAGTILAAGAVLAGTAAAASPAPASTPQCSAADLGAWVPTGQGEGAAGTLYFPLEFTNVSHQACTMYGFPGVSATGVNGKQLGSPADRDHAVAATTVRLAPGGTAYALLEYSDVITGNCPPADQKTALELRVYPPGSYQADSAYWDLATCTAPGQTHFLRVRVTAPGIGVRGSDG